MKAHCGYMFFVVRVAFSSLINFTALLSNICSILFLNHFKKTLLFLYSCFFISVRIFQFHLEFIHRFDMLPSSYDWLVEGSDGIVVIEVIKKV